MSQRPAGHPVHGRRPGRGDRPDAANGPLPVIHHSSGQLTRQEDRNKNDIRFEYTSGLLTKVTDTQDRVINLTYSGGRLDTVTDPTGRTLHYYYTADGNVSDFVDANGKTTNYRYHPELLTKVAPRRRLDDQHHLPR
ncbi:hypothetical protein [Micromonospora globispora]|uniref:hypothetical protein n=1 Tax=Micromonospora globispora TaxID=1450148 RepID=UPI000F4EA259|nr:hypothetical protein [Micromonospora globispora]